MTLNPRSLRRITLVGVVLASQLLTACCVLPPWGGHYGRGHRWSATIDPAGITTQPGA